MTEPAIKAMIQLMDDSDKEVVQMVEDKIRTLGPAIIPILESEWENLSLNPILQVKIENLIHDFQLELVQHIFHLHWPMYPCLNLIPKR